jgi:hypothetical protein
MVLGSTDVAGRPEGFETFEVGFPEGSADLDRNCRERLQTFSIRFKAATNDPVRVTVRVQGEGERPYDTALERFESLQMYLDALGFDRERLSFEYAGPGAGATMRMGAARSQVIASHEFGHQAGLRDEYATDPGGGVQGTSGPAGLPGGHDTLAKSVGLDGSVVENRDSLMSLGAALRPSYGAPFLWALRKVTRMDAWSATPPSREPNRGKGGS